MSQQCVKCGARIDQTKVGILCYTCEGIGPVADAQRKQVDLETLIRRIVRDELEKMRVR